MSWHFREGELSGKYMCHMSTLNEFWWPTIAKNWKKGGFWNIRIFTRTYVYIYIYWVVVSNIFYFHPEPWGNDPIWLTCFKGVGSTTNSYMHIQILTPSASEAAAAGKSQNDLALYRFYLAYRHRMSPGGLGGEWPIGTGAQWRSYEYKLISDGNIYIYIWYMIYVFLEYLH